MTQEAHEFLNRVRAGANASEAEIIDALRSTGDVPFDTVIRVNRPAGSWESLLPSQMRPDPLGGLLMSCPKTLERVARESAAP